MATPGKLNDVNMLAPMLDEIRRRGFEFAGCLLHADKGYDAGYTYRMIFWTGMIPPPAQGNGGAPPTGPRPTGRRRPGCSTRTSIG